MIEDGFAANIPPEAQASATAVLGPPSIRYLHYIATCSLSINAAERSKEKETEDWNKATEMSLKLEQIHRNFRDFLLRAGSICCVNFQSTFLNTF